MSKAPIQRIKRISTALFLTVVLLCQQTGAAYAAAPDTQAKAYMLMEASTGRVLLSKNENEKLPMASTTKIMTCLLAVENGNMEDVVTVVPEAVGLEGTSIYLREGEKLTLHDLVYGLMLASGNDAAVMIAIHLAGSVENFAKMMNEKAKEIGANDTNFVTPNGLPDDNHYTTAHDLALISCYAMRDERFREIVGTTSMDLPEDDDSPARYLRSKNKILYQYEGGNGIKTGYTKKAGKCLSAAAYREDMQLVAVVLNDYAMFDDCKDLLTYGFETFDMKKVAVNGEDYGVLPVAEGIESEVEIALDRDISLPLTEEEFIMVEKKVNTIGELTAPVTEGTQVGTVEFYLNGQKMAEAGLVTTGSVLENSYEYNLGRILKRWLGFAGWRSFEDSEIYGSGGGGLPAQVGGVDL